MGEGSGLIGHLIDLNGAKLYLREEGQGETLLYLHGLQGLTDESDAVARLAQRFHVLAPDHPGFGRSDSPDWLDDVTDLAFFYLDLLDRQGNERVHLVGHSLGGWVALEMAIRSTARLKSLTLVSAAGIRVDGVPRGDMFIGPASDLGTLLFVDEEAAARWMSQRQATPALHEIDDKNRAAAAKYTWQPRLYNPKLAKWLHRIDVPTHVVWGEGDRLIPPPYAAALAAQIRGAEQSILPGCGHCLDLERPDLLTDTIARFIERKRS